jgi:hypothetical protein
MSAVLLQRPSPNSGLSSHSSGQASLQEAAAPCGTPSPSAPRQRRSPISGMPATALVPPSGFGQVRWCRRAFAELASFRGPRSWTVTARRLVDARRRFERWDRVSTPDVGSWWRSAGSLLQAVICAGSLSPPFVPRPTTSPPGVTLTAQYLNSGILPNGSSAGLVSMLAAAS